VQTFTAPIVPELTAPLSLTFQVTATSANSSLTSTPAQLTVVVNPQTDVVIVTSAIYLTRKARLGITATDFTPGVTLTVTLDIINPATGQPYSAVMGQAIPGGPGAFDIEIDNLPPPNLITITSSGGGVTTTGLTVVR
jgi:hypothetical protein